MSKIIPVVLFAYARPTHLKSLLSCLRENRVPLIYAFSDGPKAPEMEPLVGEVREILRQVDWCELHIVERKNNLGLGTSILSGVSEVFRQHEALIVFEDDLVCAPGTYEYLAAAMEHYQNNPEVMSVSGWTHPRVTPRDVVNQPYFDGRADCLAWGTWRHVWKGMDENALTMIERCKQNGIDIYRYGADLVEMAQGETVRNIWGVRFLYLHILNKGLCFRPPYSLVQHTGYGGQAVNVRSIEDYGWHVDLPERCPPIPEQWPPALENPECPLLWQKELGSGQPPLVSGSSALSRLKNSLPGKVARFVFHKAKGLIAFLSSPRRVWLFLARRLIWNRGSRLERFGSSYGGWTVCTDNLGEESIVYSVGVGEDITFDLDLIQAHGCSVFAFDPTPRAAQWIRRQAPPPQFHFFELGLSNYDGAAPFFPPENPNHVSHTLLERPQTKGRAISVQVRTLKSMMEYLGHKAIDLLKMDIEGAEYHVLDDFLAAGLEIRQIAVEYHHFPPRDNLSHMVRSVLKLFLNGYRLVSISPSGEEYTFLRGQRKR